MRLVRNQLIAFVVVTVLGLAYAMAQYAGLDGVLGVGQYTVTVQLPAAGGLYANAAVTERGVGVGKVDAVSLTQQAAVARISLNRGIRIPADLHATVANTSVIGEQYLALTPRSGGGPYLADGSVIPVREVTLPPTTGSLLANAAALLRSVPRDKLNTTVGELYTAFNGTGPRLRRLLVSASRLLNAASRNEAPTRDLIGEAGPVLSTQSATAADIRSFSRNLAAFTTQLRASDGDLAGALDRAPGLTSQLNDLIGQLQPTVPLLLANLDSTAQVLRVYLPGLRQFLVIFPADLNDLAAETLDTPYPGNSYNADVMMQQNDPPACTSGYLKPPWRRPDDTAAKRAPDPTPYCAVPHDSVQAVRGAHNFPCPSDPALRSASAAGCGLDFGTPASASPAPDGAPSGRPGRAASGTGSADYDPSTGLLIGPRGLLYSVGPGSRNGTGPTTFAGLLHQTLGGD